MNVPVIPRSWETERLAIDIVTEADLDELQLVNNDTFTLNWISNPESYNPQWAQTEFNTPELPPRGTKETHFFQVIRTKSESKAIGYMISDYGFPTCDSAWIADLFFRKDSVSQGFGREVVAGFVEQLKVLNHYKTIGCTVRLKNWPGIRFWSRIGFDQITAVFGDDHFGAKTDADLALQHTISDGLRLDDVEK